MAWGEMRECGGTSEPEERRVSEGGEQCEDMDVEDLVVGRDEHCEGCAGTAGESESASSRLPFSYTGLDVSLCTR